MFIVQKGLLYFLNSIAVTQNTFQIQSLKPHNYLWTLTEYDPVVKALAQDSEDPLSFPCFATYFLPDLGTIT